MITVYCGPMFAGKSEALWRVWNEAENPVAFKPAMDDRDAADCFITHAGHRIPCAAVATAGDLLDLVPSGCDAVLVDEGQFLGGALTGVLRRLDRRGVPVYVACLDMDCHGLPFGAVGDLLATADRVVKLRAVCARCGNPATRSHRTVRVEGRDFIGGAEAYEPLCGRCFDEAD